MAEAYARSSQSTSSRSSASPANMAPRRSVAATSEAVGSASVCVISAGGGGGGTQAGGSGGGGRKSKKRSRKKKHGGSARISLPASNAQRPVQNADAGTVADDSNSDSSSNMDVTSQLTRITLVSMTFSHFLSLYRLLRLLLSRLVIVLLS